MAEEVEIRSATQGPIVYGTQIDVSINAYRLFGPGRFEKIAVMNVRHDAVEKYPDKYIGIARIIGWYFWRWIGDEEEGFKQECPEAEAQFATLFTEVPLAH